MSHAEHIPVVVVGAGPAGSMAAYEAARLGVPVVLLNRDTYPGERNVCGGALAASVIERLDLPTTIVDREISAVALHFGERRRRIETRKPKYVSVQRRHFDRCLAERAVAAGATLRNGWEVQAVDAEGRCLRGVDPGGRPFTIRADLLVFADGPHTLAHEPFGIGCARDQYYFVAMHYDVRHQASDNAFDLYLAPEQLPTSYFWVFPKTDFCNVGVGGLFRSQTSVNYRTALDAFVKDHPALQTEAIYRREGGVIPAVPAERFVAEGAMVVGDAAGLVNPLTGGGLIHALKSGELAGRTAARAYHRADFQASALASYPAALRRTPHYLWIRGLYAVARYHLYRCEHNQSNLLEQMLRAYFAVFHRASGLVRL